jgi:hypothetical protein
MKKSLSALNLSVLVLVILFPLVGVVSAQEKLVEQIRRQYEDIGKKIDLSESASDERQYAGIFCNELVFNKNDHIWPVVGNYQVIYRFYYELAHTEGHEYPDRLRKVVMNSSMSDRSYFAEYFYDDSGALVFYFARPDVPPIGLDVQPVEQRIYFEHGRPIRMSNGLKVRDKLTATDVEAARRISSPNR